MCHDRVWPWARILCCHRAFWCRDKVWPGQAFSCHNRMFFYVAIKLAMVERLYIVTEYFMSRPSVAKWRGFVLRQGILCYDIVGQGRENFCCDRGLLCHDRVGHYRDALSRTTSLKCAQQSRARDKGILSRQRFLYRGRLL